MDRKSSAPRHHGGRDPGSLNGTGWIDLVHPEDRAVTGDLWAAALRSGQTYQTEFRLRRHDGDYRWHLARALPICDTAGHVERWIGTNTDIEEQRHASQALESLNATLAQRVAEQALGQPRAPRLAPESALL